MVETKLRQRDINVGASTVHLLEAGDPNAHPILFLHGWPQCATAWTRVLELASDEYRGVAIDLPGIGGSVGSATDGTKSALAGFVEVVAETLKLGKFILVGHDIGGMIAYSYLRDFAPKAVVILNTVVPGLDPWDRVRNSPDVWHFGLHAVEGLPERLVQGKQRIYFDFFFDWLSASKTAISSASREASVNAYGSDAALKSGFDWYRALNRDAERNSRATTVIATPLLYLRGQHDVIGVEEYVAGFRKAGLQNVTSATVPGAGHFAAEQAPEATWQRIREFVRTQWR